MTEDIAQPPNTSAAPPTVEEDGPPEALLVPIAGDDPCGTDLRYEGSFDEVREARRDEDPDLPQGVWETDVKRADWEMAARLCQEALSEKSKDLHFALWLTEAWTHREGLRGFRRGIDLTCSLCEEFWEELYPKVDDDGDLDYRLGPIRWAAENFDNLLRLVVLTAPISPEARQMRLKDWQDVLRLENLAERDPDAAAKEQPRYPTRQAFHLSTEFTPVDHFVAMLPIVEACVGEIERLDLFLEERCPKDGPSLRRIRDVLSEIENRLKTWIVEKGGVLPADVPSAAEDGAEKPVSGDQVPTGKEEGAAMSSLPDGPIESRADAYRRLSEAADYLIRTEPHSPVPYVVKRAVAWGNLSFGELLVELMEGGGDHQRVLRLFGLDEMGKNRVE